MPRITRKKSADSALLSSADVPSDAGHQAFMERAIGLAERAAASGEVPVGAVVVLEGVVIGSGFNQPIASHDPSAHAEILALREAAASAGNYRLVDAVVYVTLEPCAMCLAALEHARVAQVVYGCAESKFGAIESAAAPDVSARFITVSGVLAKECSEIMTRFFEQRRRS